MKTKKPALALAAVIGCGVLCGTALAASTVIDEVANAPLQPHQIIDRKMRDKVRDGVSLQAVQTAFDESDPRANVQHFKYHPDMTYKLRLREFMDTTVVLPEGEEIEAYSLGDTKNFHFSPYTPATGKDSQAGLRNMFRVNGDYPGADTNLTVITKSRRIYPFYLRIDSVKSTYLPVLLAYIEASPLYAIATHTEDLQKIAAEKQNTTESRISDTPKDAFEAEQEAEYLRQLDIPKARDVNYSYVMSGNKELAPIKVFDDGVWTYFKFADENLDKVKRLPTIYRVVDGVDSPVNTRVVAGTLIAETTSKNWTLRNGEAHLCIKRR